MSAPESEAQLVGRVAELWRYPVKSLLGERCAELELDGRGVVGDRLWALRDGSGRLGSGKDTRRFRNVEGLFGFAARYEGDVPVLRFPDGGELRADDSRVNEALSRALGLDLWLAREDDLPHLDAGPVHLVTSAALAWLEAEIGAGAGDARRFRPNLVLDVEGEGALEGEWIGGELWIGEGVRARVSAATTRCRMTGFAQSELAADGSALRFLSRVAAARFGVYLEPQMTGRVRVGDEVRFTWSAG